MEWEKTLSHSAITNGGKNSHLSWLLPLLPTEGIEHYVEPFCGSAAVLLNRPPAPCETINDMNGRIVNFFRTARDHSRELRRALMLTPYAEEELRLSESLTTDRIEDARRFIIGIQIGIFAIGARRGGKAQMRLQTKSVQFRSPPRQLQNATKDYRAIRKRVLNVQIKGPGDGISLIEQCDAQGTFFYLDPPYLLDTRNAEKVYENEMADEEHDRLLLALYSLKGRAAISGYPSQKYDLFFRLNGWRRHEEQVRSTIGKLKTTRTEVLWMNYDENFIKYDRPNPESLRHLRVQQELFA